MCEGGGEARDCCEPTAGPVGTPLARRPSYGGALSRTPQEGTAITPPTLPNGGTWQANLERQLGPLLGDFTAKMAVQTASQRACKRPPEQLTRADIPALLEGLRPMLNTFLGVARAKAVLEQLAISLGRP